MVSFKTANTGESLVFMKRVHFQYKKSKNSVWIIPPELSLKRAVFEEVSVYVRVVILLYSSVNTTTFNCWYLILRILKWNALYWVIFIGNRIYGIQLLCDLSEGIHKLQKNITIRFSVRGNKIMITYTNCFSGVDWKHIC